MLAIRGLAALLITTTAVLLLTCLHAIEAGTIVCCINHDRRVFRLSVFKVLMSRFLERRSNVFKCFLDENCTGEVCASHQFECASGHCIPFSWSCDGENDCGDSSDENEHCRGESR